MIAARLTLTSPAARRLVIVQTLRNDPEQVSKWANRKLAEFARRLGVHPLACDWDLQQRAVKRGTN